MEKHIVATKGCNLEILFNTAIIVYIIVVYFGHDIMEKISDNY